MPASSLLGQNYIAKLLVEMRRRVSRADPDIMQRNGIEKLPGCVYVLNNLGDKWSGTSVKTQWKNQKFAPVAWDGYDIAHPNERTTDSDGNAEFPAPPRGYGSMQRFRQRVPGFSGDILEV